MHGCIYFLQVLSHIFYYFRFFSVFSADTEKVAELQVAIVLESLMGKK